MEAGNVYRILLTKDCHKSINKAPAPIKLAVEKALSAISISPSNGTNIKRLKGEFSGYYRYRIGNYRLIYLIDHNQIIVNAIKFGARGDVYK